VLKEHQNFTDIYSHNIKQTAQYDVSVKLKYFSSPTTYPM